MEAFVMKARNPLAALCLILAVLGVCSFALPMQADAAITLHWPVPGHFSLTQNYHDGHKAIDISDSKIGGAAIVSVCDGTITRIRTCTKNHPGEYGDCSGTGTGVLIKGSDNRYYSYGHMKAGSMDGFKVGQKVTAGQVIGYVGNTGNSYGNHLHFSISKDTDYKVGYNPEKETFINVGIAKPFTFAKNTDLMTVSNTDAKIAVTLTKPLENRIIKHGAAVYNADGVKLGSVWQESSLTQDTQTAHMYWSIKKDMGITLNPGTKYQFDFWATVSGVTLTSDRYTFTTTGTPQYTVDCYDNYSGKNYFVNSDFTKGLDTNRYKSRNASVYTLAVDTAVKHDSRYNTLKIVGASAGNGSSNDLAFTLNVSGSKDHQYYVGDSTTMTLSFWAKGTANGAKLHIRWGWQPVEEAKTVILSDQWQYYTVSMPRKTLYGNNLHPFFDKAGTFWLSELQMEDGTQATAFAPEQGTKTSFQVAPGKTYSALPTPTREGYTFLGWSSSLINDTTTKPSYSTSGTIAIKKTNNILPIILRY